MPDWGDPRFVVNSRGSSILETFSTLPIISALQIDSPPWTVVTHSSGGEHLLESEIITVANVIQLSTLLAPICALPHQRSRVRAVDSTHIFHMHYWEATTATLRWTSSLLAGGKQYVRTRLEIVPCVIMRLCQENTKSCGACLFTIQCIAIPIHALKEHTSEYQIDLINIQEPFVAHNNKITTITDSVLQRNSSSFCLPPRPAPFKPVRRRAGCSMSKAD